MNDSVFIAVHHYQNEKIVKRASLVADSYRLAVEAARSDAKYVVVCGVRFMAESVATLARPGQIVLHPNPDAGCPMADMIDGETAERMLIRLREFEGDDSIVPVTYMNSSNAVKALTGREGGAICTSGNAHHVLTHFFARGKRVFFLPDANLGLNTARNLGIPEEATVRIPREGTLPPNLERGRSSLFVWDGYCPIHRVMTVEDVAEARAAYPGTRIIVHPECVPAVAAASDATGSTEGIYKTLAAAAPGSSCGVGTELHFVERMRETFPDRKIYPIRMSSCMNMIKITEEKLNAALAAIEAGTAAEKYGVTVNESERADAERALRLMVTVTEAAQG